MNWKRQRWRDRNLPRLLVQSELSLHVNGGHSNPKQKTRLFMLEWSRKRVKKVSTHHSSLRCFYRHGAGWDRHPVATIESDAGDWGTASIKHILKRVQRWTIDHRIWTIEPIFVWIETVVLKWKRDESFRRYVRRNTSLPHYSRDWIVKTLLKIHLHLVSDILSWNRTRQHSLSLNV